MSRVTLHIAGRYYPVECAEGQEQHIASLGEMIDGTLDRLGGNLSTKDAQNLLFAALFLADDVHEMRGAKEKEPDSGLADELAALKVSERELRLELDALRTERDTLAQELSDRQSNPASGDETLAETLETIADALEKSATALESSSAAP